MSSVAKAFITVLLFLFMAPLAAKDIYILSLQENGMKDCHAGESENVQGIYQIGLDGVERDLANSLSSDNCFDDRIFLPFAREMIDKGRASRIIFMTISQENLQMKDWLNEGPLRDKLEQAIKVSNYKKIKFDYGFWQGGLVNKNLLGNSYISSVRKVVKSISLGIPVEKWILALSADCNRTENEPIMIIRNPLLNRFSGPDIGTIGLEYRSDACTLSYVGRAKLAKLWTDSVAIADRESLKYQKESLLYYFK